MTVELYTNLTVYGADEYSSSPGAAAAPLKTASDGSITLDHLHVTNDAAAATHTYTSSLVAAKNSTTYNGYAFVPLTAPLTSTSWDGDAYSTTAKTSINLSAVFGAPAGIKAILARVAVRDSASAATSPLWFCLAPNDTAGQGIFWRPSGYPNDYNNDTGASVIPCDANGDVYYQVLASGSGTMDVHIQIWGYLI